MIYIPPRYEKSKIDDVPKEIRELFEKLPETRRGIFIHGDVGTGKTHMIYALRGAWDATRAPDGRERRSMFWNTTELLHSIRSDFDRHNADKFHAEEKIKEQADLLFLDDLGSEKMSDWVGETFYRIINDRYNRMLPTIYTSNFGVADLAERIGDRIVSRIVGSSDVVELQGQDRRITNKKITIKI